MADNVAITAGSGTTIAADDIGGGVLVQRVKLGLGADGTAVDAVGGTGANGTGVQRVTIATDDTLVASLATKLDTLAGYLDTVEAKLQAIADDVVAATVATATADVAANAAGLPVRQVPGETHVGALGGHTIVQAASGTITRPANTTQYASGDLVANSVTAGSVTNLQFTTAARISGGSGLIVGARIQKSTNVVTSAAFRLHLFSVAPTYTSSGDNDPLSTVVVASAKGYLGYVDITAMTGFSDVAWGTGAIDNSRGNAPFVAAAQIIYGLLEARGAYTPGNAEVFTVSLMALQD